MLKKIAIFCGLFVLAAIAIVYLGTIRQSAATAICPTVDISSRPLLTQVPENPLRTQEYLNGVWDFIPATTAQPPQQGWGKIRVPGDWQQEGEGLVPGVIERGSSNSWQDFDGKQLLKAWYRREIAIPATWQNRAIVVNLDRVSTDAKLYVNNRECGAIAWPYGAVDISQLATPGETVTLDILVAAVADAKDKLTVMSPNEIYVDEGDNHLDSKGLIGEVRLLSYPQNAHISDVFVQPSVRQRQLNLEVEVAGVQQAENVAITATLFNEAGQVEKEFTTSSRLRAKPTQTLEMSWDWQKPRLWDIGQPNLYTLRLNVQGENIEDNYDQSFGFREFWVEGRNFYLNNTEIKLRPTLHEDNWQGWGVGVPEVIDSAIEGYLATGYNIAQLWPWNYYERGRWHFRDIFAERAALKGFPVIAPALDAVRDGYTEKWNRREGKAVWEAKLQQQMRRDRGEPAILMWANSPNFFGHSDDQNPRRIGIEDFAGGLKDIENDRMAKLIPIGKDIIATIKKYDPTRPAMMHQGAAVGDVYALNSYLNLIPLQEREEWLSHWAENGEMPYLVVEFGTPLHASIMRGRNGFGQVIHSEPLMTEYSAIYTGKEAYQLEKDDYRSKISEYFQENQQYQNWQLQPEVNFAPAFQKVQDLFITNTWRSWRTYGISGGMIPWNEAHGWQATPEGKKWVNLADYAAGKRGPFPAKTYRYFFDYLSPTYYNLYPAAKALIANDSPTLAWIGGSKTAFVEKDHNYLAGDNLEKQAILINDTRSPQNYELTWQVEVAGNVIASGQESGTINISQRLFFPITTSLPQVSNKTDGKVSLKARIANTSHQDNFAFRIFNSTPTLASVTLFDPVGKTHQMLQQLGYEINNFNSNTSQTDLVIIGREVLSSNHKLPFELETYLRNGGRILIETQNRDWLETKWGFRVAQHLSRRVFPVDSQHPIMQGLDATDLRDWRGESTLISAYPNSIENPTQRSDYGTPWYGWHWGNRGTISSAAIEKPHFSAWQPILETEFDLAYSPLLELNYGKGKAILNTLDIEDYARKDGAAQQITHQIINYAANSPISPSAAKVVLWGDETDAAFVDTLGLNYKPGNNLDTNADLILIGSKTKPSDNELRNYLENGGKVFFLPREAGNNPLGVQIQPQTFSGSLKPPNWTETKGISTSDLHPRSDYNTHLITNGGEIAADGLLSRVKIGEGVVIFSQLNPPELNADQNTYLRLTRWRQYHAIAQILANLGASFQADSNSLKSTEDIPYYHPDYRSDFDLGDNPYRYYRW
ncbi:MAG: hypothetical protein SAJ12_08925 [Jaaginema sp. PMC 1079.18]|nr:hypothetical protein [Jaaginema sp. PMC 1080.18]MEC4851123.1 hypothetical protein [Jaaginema sp. PMC 1079.18]MEC4868239.1 hypothetical protein [Jaaginema sp. PMC 1078.18]